MEQGYDQERATVTRAETEDYWLPFRVPPGLMPDPRFAGRPARLHVHRVYPVYDNDPNLKVPTRAVVLIHGRTVAGPVVFDLREPGTGGGALSVQNALALAGIDTFAPSLLGYGRSTRFDEGLNDPANASLRPYPPDTTCCPYPEGCDRTLIPGINPLDQQGSMLLVNPLGGQRRAHSSKFRFARTDVWVRDIDQVINFAIEENTEKYTASPDGKKVALVGYSLGGQHVGRTLYKDNPNEQLLYADDAIDPTKFDPAVHQRKEVFDKVSRVMFVNSLFGGPTEERDPFGPPTFPMTLEDRSMSDAIWTPFTTANCPGRVKEATQAQVWAQRLADDPVGRQWGGTVAQPAGLNRAPTFSGYGWNPAVARQLSKPTLVVQGLLDGALPLPPNTSPADHAQAIYDALESVPQIGGSPNKVLVKVECASHALPWEECDGECKQPHLTLKQALINWIMSGVFRNHRDQTFTTGTFTVKRSGEVITP